MTRECQQDAALCAMSPLKPATALSRQGSQNIVLDTSVESECSDPDERLNLTADLARATEEHNIIVQENVLLKENLFSY